ncbi:MAG: hypothetical protein WC346_16150 [Methanogenium sp.]|jgi:Zn-dependent M16 (insulinase) family peptidase
MKKIFLTLIFYSSILLSQTFDPPKWYTEYYKLRMWEQKARPGADSLNMNWKDIDSLISELIIFLDTLQIQKVEGNLRFSKYMSGIDSFTTTAITDTVYRTGVDSYAVVMACVRGIAPTANDLISVEILNDKFVVKRQEGGTSNLKYNWIWIRKYIYE